MNVVVSPNARADLERICDYISRFNPDAATRVWDSAVRTFERLGDFPLMGRQRKYANPSLPGVRTVAVEDYRNYLIFYRQREDHIQIMRVLHGARNLEVIFGES